MDNNNLYNRKSPQSLIDDISDMYNDTYDPVPMNAENKEEFDEKIRRSEQKEKQKREKTILKRSDKIEKWEHLRRSQDKDHKRPDRIPQRPVKKEESEEKKELIKKIEDIARASDKRIEEVNELIKTGCEL